MVLSIPNMLSTVFLNCSQASCHIARTLLIFSPCNAKESRYLVFQIKRLSVTEVTIGSLDYLIVEGTY